MAKSALSLLRECFEMISRPYPGPVGHVSVSLVVTTEPLDQPLQRSMAKGGMAGKPSPCPVAGLGVRAEHCGGARIAAAAGESVCACNTANCNL